MRYLIYIALALALVLALAPAISADEVWRPPADCAPEDRTIKGNTNSPCKLVFPAIESVEYQVLLSQHKLTCVETLIISAPGIDMPEHGLSNKKGAELLERWTGRSGAHNHLEMWGILGSNTIYFLGKEWKAGSTVGGQSRFTRLRPDTHDTKVVVYYYSDKPDGQSAYILSEPLPIPDFIGRSGLANACLARLDIEIADREHAAELARQKVVEAARILAEADARAKEEEQATREKEVQATIAAESLEQLRKSKESVARTEVVKTQTLVAKLAHHAARTAILQEIVRIRLAGEEDRARLLNEYLIGAQAISEAFDTETAEVETRINEYIEFNRQLLTAIQGYQTAVQARLESAQAQLAEQEAALVELTED